MIIARQTIEGKTLKALKLKEVMSGFWECPPFPQNGGGGGNRTHVRRIISKADYVCIFELLSQREDYRSYVSSEEPSDF